jgi:uncharacterized iron-regulated membrane protein
MNDLGWVIAIGCLAIFLMGVIFGSMWWEVRTTARKELGSAAKPPRTQ